MKKIIYIILVSCLILPQLALASNDVTFPQDITITLNDGSNYSLGSESTFDSFTVNTASINFTVSASSIVYLVSYDRKLLTVTGTDSNMTTATSCTSGYASSRVTVSSSATAAVTITITPGAVCSSGSGGSNTPTPGGGINPGSSSTPPATPPATPPQTTPPATPPVTTPPESPSSAVTSPEDVTTLLSSLNANRDQAKETKNLPKVSTDLAEFKITATAGQKSSINNFVTYGISANTVKLGEGERRAVIRDYLDTVKTANITWSDIERITTGQKPINRNLKAEQAQVPKVLAAFKKVVGHTPNFKNAKEDLAWNTMMYRIRFTRDLNKETQGIKDYKAKFGKNPSTPLDWATVRATGYALK